MRALLGIILALAGLVAAEDPLIAAVDQALARGDAVQAALLLDDHPDLSAFGAIRIRDIRTRLAAGDGDGAAALLGWDGRAIARDWGGSWRGAALVEAGVWFLRREDFAAAAQQFAGAIDARGREVAVDRCLLLVAQCLKRAGDTALARRYAERLWRNFGRSPHRWAGGLLYAALLVDDDPAKAERILNDLRLWRAVPEDIARQAGLLLCQLGWPRQLERVYRVASAGCARWPTSSSYWHWRFRAAIELDPGRRALEIAAMPTAIQAELGIDRLAPRVAGPERPPAVIAYGQARAAIAADDPATASKALQPHVADDVHCARLYAMVVPEPAAVAAAAWAGDAVVATTLADRLARAGSDAAAIGQLLRRVDPTTFTAEQEAPWRRYWYLCGRMGVNAEQAWGELRKMDGDGREIGEAWARLAQVEDDPDAWLRAAEALPVGHPWQAQAIKACCRRWLAAVPAGARAELSEPARAALIRLAEPLAVAAWHDDAEEALALRWLLLQVQAQLGRMVEARACLDGLIPFATGERLVRLRAVDQRLGG